MLQAVMDFLVPLILGMAVSTIIEAVTGKTWGLFVRKQFQRKADKRLSELGIQDDLIRRGQESMYVIEYVPDGWAQKNIDFSFGQAKNLETALNKANAENLPGLPTDILREIDETREKLDRGVDGWWNGETIAVDFIETGRLEPLETPILRIATFPSEHAAQVVCTTRWQAAYDQGLVVLPEKIEVPIPGMIHAIGLNATVLTDDRKLILVKRSDRADSGRSGFHISVNEGMQRSDKNLQGKLDPHVGIVRGIREELGLTVDVEKVSFHTAMFDVRRYQFGLLGHVDLRGTGITAADIVVARKLGLSKDKFENSEVIAIPWDFESVVEKLKEQNWVAHGWLNLLHSAMSSFSPRAAELHQLFGNSNK